MCEYLSGVEPPEKVYTPCCVYLRSRIRSKDLNFIKDLCRSLSYKWKVCYRGFPPYWELYIAEEDLTEEELSMLKNGELIKL